MKKLKYFVFDFDGTILNSQGEISDNLVNKLISMQNQGYKVILCSGRSLPGIMWVADKINLKKYAGYIVAYNGSQIYKYKNNKIEQIHNITLPKKQVEEINDLIVNDVQCFSTYCDNYMGVSKMIPRIQKSSKIMGVELNLDYIKESPKIVVYDSKENIAKNYDKLKTKVLNYDNTLNVFSSVPEILEITPANASKGYALKMLVEKENLNKEQLICFGDAENDLSMFEYCKHSVAMENAMDCIKELATYHTKTNNEDGVFQFLEAHF